MEKKNNKGGILGFLYNTTCGRILLRPLKARWLTYLSGVFLDLPISKPLIKPFVKNNNIDLSEYESDNFKCFNDCFCRKIKSGFRPVDMRDSALVSPCDGLLSAYKISGEEVYPVKQSRYTLGGLLKNDSLAKEYNNGTILIFRLSVNHYHRYCYPASGIKGDNIYIKGAFHTVRPVALAAGPVFCENAREYTVIDTKPFGKIVQMEVGAMLVGKIKNHRGVGKIKKGEEKGMFLYGGSTVILLLKENSIKIKEEYLENTQKGIETPVKQGETLNII